ncbi:nuclease-related domain-containing protein [Siminovitchia fortis]|uniref:nuclease-related domain-containing protein n=1 Tax=Siminovitchia fortis TaxID=254758 RepID=UPI00164290AA|nr:nuclease-related domain-containing protein [Siminovitchia fortis]
MIKKRRTIPPKIPALEACLRRIFKNHSSVRPIQEELAIRSSGYQGERTLDFYLNQLPRDNHFIFQDLRLPLSQNSFFQIDAFLLSNRYSINYEAKNYSDLVIIDEHQIEHRCRDRTYSYENPIIQAENQLFHLQNLIDKHLNIKLPSTSFVVMTNSSSIVKFDPAYREIAAPKVIRPSALRQKTDSFSKMHTEVILTNGEMQKITNLLLKLHTPSCPDNLSEFNIKKEDILPGVHCLNCQSLSMARCRGSWICANCGYKDSKAHIPALLDYYYLFGASITNRQFRQFVKLPSRSVASKLLASLKLPFSGKNKNRVYYLSPEHLRRWL